MTTYEDISNFIKKRGFTMDKIIMIIIYSFLSLTWINVFVHFCLGNSIDQLTIGCSLAVTIVTCLTWLKNKIKE